MDADEIFEKMVNEGLNKFFEKNPDFATHLGLHEPYDYMLPKGSTERFLENLQLMEELLKRLSENLKRKELNDDHKIDWEVLEKAYERWKFDFYERRIHELNPDVSEDLGGLIFIMFTRNYAPLERRLDAITARIEKMPKYLEEFRSRFEKSQPVRLWTQLAIEKTQSMIGLFMFILQAVKGKVPDKVYERLQKAVENLQPALKAYLEWLHGLLTKTSEEWALGKEKFERLLQLRELGMNSEEILHLGVKYLNELKAERERLAKQIAPGKTVEEVLEMIERKAPKTFEEALEYTKKVMEEARHFVQERGIATVYPEDVLLVEETQPLWRPSYPLLL
jgi:histone H3/H4